MMAGTLKMDWRPYTLKVMWGMYQSSLLDAYDHTSRIMMMQSWSSKSNVFYHPYRRDTATDLNVKRTNISDLASVFINR